MASIAMIPYSAAIGAEVDIESVTIVNESAGGITGRETIRQLPKRNFHLTIGPNTAAEVRSIWYTHRRKWPVAVRDWNDYTYTNEPLAYTFNSGSAIVPLQKTIAPATGSRFLTQRILIPDENEVLTVVSVNGTPLARSAWSFTDFGIINIPGLGGGTVTATGNYLVAACFNMQDDILTMKVQTVASTGPLLSIDQVLLREIFEQDLIELMSEPDDSV